MANNKMTNPSWNEYGNGIAEYASKNPGSSVGYGLGWVAFGASIAFLGAAAVCPAMIPFAFVQAGFWVKAVELTVSAGVLVGSGYYVAPQIAKPFQITHARNQTSGEFGLNLGEKLTHSALLGTVAIASTAFVAALFLAPAMLPFGLAAVAAYSMWLQAGIAVTLAATAVVSTMTLVGLWKDKTPAAPVKKTKLVNGLDGVEADNEADADAKDEEEKGSCFSFRCGSK